jgi:hypothetical protein
MLVIRGGGDPVCPLAFMPTTEWTRRLGASPQKRMTASWSASGVDATEYKVVVRVAHTDAGSPSDCECHVMQQKVDKGTPIRKTRKNMAITRLTKKSPYKGQGPLNFFVVFMVTELPCDHE